MFDDGTVMEYDEEPATEILSRTLKVPPETLSEVLLTHPMGRIAGGDIYITEANEIFPDGSISYYSRIYNHTKMLLLELDNVQRVWNETVQRVLNDISINCISRSRLFEKDGCFGEFVNVLRNYGKYIGVSGYGEQLDFIHLNQTMVLLVFE